MLGINKEICVLEGSQWTQIENYTGPVGDHPLWICRYGVESPQSVIQMHKDYLNAGADLVLSLTYQLTIDGLMKSYTLSNEEAWTKISDIVQLARTAWDEHIRDHPAKDKSKPRLVGGSVGPYGAILHDGSEYTGSYIDSISEDELVEFHRPRVKALVDAGVDFLVFETLPSIVEAHATLRVLREFPNMKAWLSLSSQDGINTCKGEPYGESLVDIWTKGKDQLLAVGCNCLNPNYVKGLLQQVKSLTDENIPFVVYPNSGESYSAEKGWHGLRVNLASLAPDWIQLGAKIVGGCCRTTTSDIAGIREVDGINTCKGEPYGESLVDIWTKGKDQLLAVGCNCLNPNYVKGLLKQVKSLTDENIPFVVYPNSGESYSAEKGWHGLRVDLASLAPDWIQLGAKIVGGCCRTTTSDIAGIREVVNKFNENFEY